MLAGHSVGAVAAELAVTSFGDALGVDGLIVLALANQGYTPASLQESFVQGGVCTTGGEPAEEGQPSGYAYYAQTPEDWKPLLFASASPAVQEAAVARAQPRPVRRRLDAHPGERAQRGAAVRHHPARAAPLRRQRRGLRARHAARRRPPRSPAATT